MDRKQLLFPCGLVLSTIYLSASYDASFAFDRPLHTAAVVYLFAGLALVAHACYRPPARKHRYHAIPLSNGHSAQEHNSSPTGHCGQQRILGVKAQVALALLLVVLLCGRASIFWRVMKEVECSGVTLLAWIPLIVAIVHTLPSWRTVVGSRISTQGILYPFYTDPWCYVLPALLLSLSIFMAGIRLYPLRSTFICPDSSEVIRLQLFGFFQDCTIALTAYALLADRGDSPDARKGNLLLGFASLAAAALLAISGMFSYATHPELRSWLLSAPSEYIGSLLSLSVTITCIIAFFLLTIPLYGIMSTFLILGFSSAFTTIFRVLSIPVAYSFPPKPTTELIVYASLLLLGLLLYLAAESGTAVPSRPKFSCRPRRFQLAVIAIVVWTPIFLYFSRKSYWHPPVEAHPIKVLMDRADTAHKAWAAQAASSSNLADAVKNYRDRYHRAPPPGFDKWYQYATERNSFVIDDFDNIEDDLRPFWSFSPAELRDWTTAILAKEGSSLGGITIRNGKAEVFGNVPGTHRWMVDGAVTMVSKFAEFLPDMDLAVNLDDESRVAPPYDVLETTLWNPKKPQNTQDLVGFSQDRAGTWKDLANAPSPDPLFFDARFKSSFRPWGSIACPPWSPARRESHWNKHDLCTTCPSSHSLGALVSNWSISADPCQQPDLAYLHGFYASPAALSATHRLVPIFSQSKAPGYADIRYPSPWNYVDKSVYKITDEYPDKNFIQKLDVMFWRGSTTEGYSSSNGAWRGMFRQRLVYLLNKFDAPQAVLLPIMGKGHTKFRYVREEVGSIKEFLGVKSDVQFVDQIVKCAGKDCVDQTKLFKAADKIDFQSHWRYKYLVDADGAGFSGRFLPFLQSNSVVFKSALFREWYEGRVRAWKHFVPLDLRLHDIWSLLAYFGGYRNRMEGEVKDAAKIARESRVLADNLLRKEDMEVYFFRLLLEWGRLTDERRNVLGFKVG